MPGLFGIISAEQKPDTQIFGKLSEYTTPFDGRAVLYTTDTAILGFNSLGIVDFPNQPYHIPKDDLHLFIWGEIYDYPDKNNSVAEYIFDLYLSAKLENLVDLNGGYSLALWDNKKHRLILASDIYATRPLYYYRSNSTLVFASNPFTIAKTLNLKKINDRALNQFLKYAIISGADTWIENIHKVLPGSYLVCEDGKLEIHPYFIPAFSEQNISLMDSAAGIIDFLEKAIVRYENDKFVLSLSGGGDSRLIAGLCHKAGYDFKAFTFGDEKCGDLNIARQVSSQLNLMHYPLLISPQFLINNINEAVYNTGGFSSAINFHGISTRDEVRKLAGVVLSGLYGNNFLGYMSFSMQKFSSINDRQKFDLQLEHWLRSGFAEEEFKGLLRDDKGYSPADSLPSILRKRYHQKSCLATLLAIDHFELNSQRSLCGFWLENDKVEYRSPFCDYDLMKFNLQIPVRYKLLMQIGREIWNRHLPELGKIIYQRTQLPINAPASMVAIKKMTNRIVNLSRPPGIMDYDGIFRTELAEWIADFLNSDNALNQEYLKRKMVTQLLMDHQNKKTDNTNKIGLLLTFEQVLRIINA